MKWLIALGGARAAVMSLVGALVGIAVDRGLLSGEVGDAMVQVAGALLAALGL